MEIPIPPAGTTFSCLPTRFRQGARFDAEWGNLFMSPSAFMAFVSQSVEPLLSRSNSAAAKEIIRLYMSATIITGAGLHPVYVLGFACEA
jgi:hypothetical protein